MWRAISGTGRAVRDSGLARRAALTGLRRGDAVRLGRQHVRDGIAEIRTEKSGLAVTVTLPILPALAETLFAGPCGESTFIWASGAIR